MRVHIKATTEDGKEVLLGALVCDDGSFSTDFPIYLVDSSPEKEAAPAKSPDRIVEDYYLFGQESEHDKYLPRQGNLVYRDGGIFMLTARVLVSNAGNPSVWRLTWRRAERVGNNWVPKTSVETAPIKKTPKTPGEIAAEKYVVQGHGGNTLTFKSVVPSVGQYTLAVIETQKQAAEGCVREIVATLIDDERTRVCCWLRDLGYGGLADQLKTGMGLD